MFRYLLPIIVIQIWVNVSIEFKSHLANNKICFSVHLHIKYLKTQENLLPLYLY